MKIRVYDPIIVDFKKRKTIMFHVLKWISYSN